MTDPPDLPARALPRKVSLTTQLAQFNEELRVTGPQWSQAYDDLVRRLKAAGAGSSAPKAGDPFPQFLLPDDRGRLISFEDLIAAGPLVITFNRGHWCSYCQMELRALQASLRDITACGASIVSITPELLVYSATCKSENGLTFPLLCDLDLGVSLSLGPCHPAIELRLCWPTTAFYFRDCTAASVVCCQCRRHSSSPETEPSPPAMSIRTFANALIQQKSSRRCTAFDELAMPPSY